MPNNKKADTEDRSLPFYVNAEAFRKADRHQKFRHIIAGILVLLMMGVIFRFSAADSVKSSGLSGGISREIMLFVSRILPGDFTAADLSRFAGLIETPVRKCAHFTEYAILCILVNNYLKTCFILMKMNMTILRRDVQRIVLRAELFCALYACSDELHQYFVPGRACRFFDVCVDSAGAFFGAVIFWLISGKAKSPDFREK